MRLESMRQGRAMALQTDRAGRMGCGLGGDGPTLLRQEGAEGTAAAVGVGERGPKLGLHAMGEGQEQAVTTRS